MRTAGRVQVGPSSSPSELPGPADDDVRDTSAKGEPARSRRAVALSGRRAVSRLTRHLTRADLVVMALYVAIPAAIDVPFSIAGRPLLAGDNLYQNFPLRVLAGRYLASGHLPAWDPFIWSGTPLLAGWNAGALFPGTWLFAVLPAVGAWTVNLILTSAVAAAGAYALLRRLGCGTLASFLGGLVFAYTGFMSGQEVHIGLVQGTSLLPWMLFAVESLARRADGERSAGWIALLGVSSALTVLAGDPRAISTSAIAVLIFLLALLVRDARSFAQRVLPAALAGAALGALLSAAQWLPGIKFVSGSQRGVTASSLFSAGSLDLPHIGALFLVPFMLGGSRNFNLLVYQGLDNIQELTIGVGLVALVAALAYLPALARSLWTWTARMIWPVRSDAGEGPRPGTGPAGGSRQLGVWYVLGTCGVLLTLGSNTRLGAVLVKIPLYGGERLQNRNAELIDLALVVLLAFFVDDLAGRSRALVEAWRPLASTTSALLGALAPLAALVLVLVGFGAPLRVERVLEMPFPVQPKLFEQEAPYLIATSVLAVLLLGFVLGLPRLSSRARRVLLAGFVLADVLTYALNTSYAAPPVSAYNGSTTAVDAVRAATGANGRFAIFDPLFSFPATGMAEPDSVGLPDLNILQRTSTVEGYGSVVDSSYQNATATHGVEDLNQKQLAGSTFDSLDLDAFITLPVYIWRQLNRGTPVPVPGIGSGTSSPTAPPDASGPYRLLPGQSETFLMAQPSALVRASAILDPAGGVGPPTLRIAEGDRLTASDPPLAVNGGVAVQGFPAGVVVDSVVVENSSDVPALIGAVSIVTRHPARRYVLDGWLQGDVAPPHWRYDGVIPTSHGDNFLLFRNTESGGAAWLQPEGTTSSAPQRRLTGATIRVLHEPIGAPETIDVDTPVPAELVRSVAYASGWSATVTPARGGRPRSETATALGLVQMVHVPAGRSVVTWHYAPRSLRDGALLSLLGLLVLASIPAVLVLRRRRRRPAAAEGPRTGAT